MVITGKVTATINGQPVELENVTFVQPPRPIEPPRPAMEWTAIMRIDTAEWERFQAALLATWSRPRYWQRRHQHQIRRFRKHLARALGVRYADMLHFCRTGKWPRSPMRLRVDPRLVHVDVGAP